jgi:hypothetical protein
LHSSVALLTLRHSIGKSQARMAQVLKTPLVEYQRWEREGIPETIRLGHLVAVAQHIERQDLAEAFLDAIREHFGPRAHVQGVRIVIPKRAA